MAKYGQAARQEFAVELCRIVGLDPSRVTRIDLSLREDGSSVLRAEIIPDDISSLALLVRTYELFSPKEVRS